MNLQPNTILKRKNEIGLRLESVHRLEIIVNKKREILSNHTLAILDVFAQPVSISDALKKLQATGQRDWMDMTLTIHKLYQLGALYNYNGEQFLADKSMASFGSSPIHIAMLNDKTRTDLFIDALRQTVTADDVVLDIGTGTGVLAIAAARAGAKKVYAVEAGAMADVAQAVINKTEVADKIEIVRGWSTQIELPERASVLVSEIIGNDPFGEKVLQTFSDARQRLLQPDARIIPGRMRVFGIPALIPSQVLQSRVLQQHDLDNWQQWYGIDFSPLQKLLKDDSDFFLMANYDRVQQMEFFNEPLLLTEVDFHRFETLQLQHTATAKTEWPFNGLLMYFELDLGNAVLTTHPRIADKTNSWVSPVWYLAEAGKLNAGDAFHIQFMYTEAKGSEIYLKQE